MQYDTYDEVYNWIEYSFDESFGMMAQHNELSIDGDLKESIIDGLVSTFMAKTGAAGTFEAKNDQEYDVIMMEVDEFLSEPEQIEYVEERLREEGEDWDDESEYETYGI